MNRNEQATAAPQSVQVGSRLLIIAKPTAAEELHIQAEWRRQCIAESKTPLQSILADVQTLPPAVAKIAIEAAVAKQAAAGKGGIVEPDEDRVFAQLFTLDGARYRLWYLARKNHPELKLEEMTEFITDENLMQVIADAFPGQSREEDDSKKSNGPTSGAITS